jgi:hypothetical protein
LVTVATAFTAKDTTLPGMGAVQTAAFGLRVATHEPVVNRYDLSSALRSEYGARYSLFSFTDDQPSPKPPSVLLASPVQTGTRRYLTGPHQLQCAVVAAMVICTVFTLMKLKVRAEVLGPCERQPSRQARVQPDVALRQGRLYRLLFQQRVGNGAGTARLKPSFLLEQHGLFTRNQRRVRLASPQAN